MTIIVTGAGGMLGKAVVEAARAAGHEVVGLTRADLDVTDERAVVAALDAYDTPAVINCAAIIRGRHPPWTKEAGYVNGTAPHRLAKWCDRLVQVSTDCVFDGKSPLPYSEDDPPNSTDWYGYTKTGGEIFYEAPHVTVRGSFIGFDHGLLAWLLAQAPKARIAGFGDHKWSGTYVADYADALVELAGRKDLTGIVHLVGLQTNKGDLLEQLAALLRPDVVVERGRAPNGPRYMNLTSIRTGIPQLPEWQFSIQRLVRDHNARAAVAQ